MGGGKGLIYSYTGPMASGKSLKLISSAEIEKIKGKCVGVFKPWLDIRDKDYIKSRFGAKLKVDYFYENSDDLFAEVLRRGCDVVVIDEAQFSDGELPAKVEILKDMGINIYLGFLNQSFKGEPFNDLVKDLLEISDYVEVLHAVCDVCKRPASKTQRIIDGRPASYYSPLIAIGYQQYQPRCRRHHEVPNRPVVYDLSQIDLGREGFIYAYEVMPEYNSEELLVEYLSRNVEGLAHYTGDILMEDLLHDLTEGYGKIENIVVEFDNNIKCSPEFAKFLDDIASKGYGIFVVGKRGTLRELLPYADSIKKLPQSLLRGEII